MGEHMLSGWNESAGALAEHKRAMQLGKEIIYEDAVLDDIKCHER